jgi:hypothetical protein
MNLCKSCRHYRPIAVLEAAGVCLRTFTYGDREVEVTEFKGQELAYRKPSPDAPPSLALAMSESSVPILGHLDVRETFGCVQWEALP